MSELIFAVMVLVVVGALVVTASNLLNRDLRKLEIAAEELVRERVRARNKRPVDGLLRFCVSSGVDEEKARLLLNRFLLVFGCSPDENKFDCSDVLGELFRVDKNSLDGFERAWKKAGLSNHIEVFSSEVMLILDELINKQELAHLLWKLDLMGADEDKIKNVIMAMDFGTFLITFAPSVDLKRGR